MRKRVLYAVGVRNSPVLLPDPGVARLRMLPQRGRRYHASGEVVVMKLSGFSVHTNTCEVMNFIKKAELSDYELFVSLGKHGQRKNLFNGTVFLLVKSLKDEASVFRLRGFRQSGCTVDVRRCSLGELRNHNLFPNPSEVLFENMSLNDSKRIGRGRTSGGSERDDGVEPRSFDCVRARDDSVPVVSASLHDHAARAPGPSPHHLGGANGLNLGIRVDVGDVECRPGWSMYPADHRKEPQDCVSPFAESSSQIARKSWSEVDVPLNGDSGLASHGCYAKIFYIGEDTQQQDVFNFLDKVAPPIEIIMSVFGEGPHCGKRRGEAFALFNSHEDAVKCLVLSNEVLGGRRVLVVIPPLEEVDSVVFSNYQHSCHAASRPPAPGEKCLARSFLNVVTNILQQSSSHAFNRGVTMVEPSPAVAPELLQRSYQSSYSSRSSSSTHLTVVKLSNVSQQVSRQEVVDFLSGFSFSPDSLKRTFVVEKKSAEWEVPFELRSEALVAAQKLNYQLLDSQPVELTVLTQPRSAE